MILLQQVKIDARLIVKPFKIGFRYKLAKILIPFLVLNKQNKMKIALALLDQTTAGCHV